MKKINLAILMLSTLTIACGVDVTDPQAGYFDDHQDKSGTQNFNNMGSGTMEVNINYNNQTTQPTIVQTVQPSTVQSNDEQTIRSSTTRVSNSSNALIAGIQFEYDGKKLYGTNLNTVAVRCDISYRTNVPKSGTLGSYGCTVKPNLNDYVEVSYYSDQECVTITFVSCEDKSSKEISSWLGNQTLCK